MSDPTYLKFGTAGKCQADACNALATKSTMEPTSSNARKSHYIQQCTHGWTKGRIARKQPMSKLASSQAASTIPFKKIGQQNRQESDSPENPGMNRMRHHQSRAALCDDYLSFGWDRLVTKIQPVIRPAGHSLFLCNNAPAMHFCLGRLSPDEPGCRSHPKKSCSIPI